jgi:hypothetical protein
MLGKILRGVAVLLVLGSGPSFAASLPTTLDNVVILARDSLRLGFDSKLASGQVVVNNTGGVLTVRPRAGALQDTEIIADIVAVQATANQKPELFDIFTNSFLNGANAIIDDVVVSPPGGWLPLFPFPSAPVVTPGTDSCPSQTGRTGNCTVRRRNGPVTLPPGDYGKIKLSGYAVLYLEGGAYNIESLSCGAFSHVLVNGTTTLNVQGNVSFAPFSTFEPADVSFNPRCVVLNVAGNRVLSVFATISASINAPDATVNLAIQTVYTGNLVGKKVRVGAEATLQAADPLLSPCPES